MSAADPPPAWTGSLHSPSQVCDCTDRRPVCGHHNPLLMTDGEGCLAAPGHAGAHQYFVPRPYHCAAHVDEPPPPG